MPENPEEGSPDIEPSLDDSSYTTTGSGAKRQTHRRLFAAVAAAVFVVTCAAGFAYSRTEGRTGDLNETTAATEPPAPTTEAPTTTAPCGPRTTEPLPPPTTSTVPTSDQPPPSTTTSTTDLPPTSTPSLPDRDCGADDPPTDPFTMPPGREQTPPDEDEAPQADAPLAERVEFAWRVGYLGNIEHTVTTDSRYGGTTSEVWWDDSTGIWRTLSFGGTGTLKGKPILDTGAAGFEGTTPMGQRQIDFCFSEYKEWSPGPLVAPETKAHRVREDFDGGLLVEDGHEVIDGRDTIRLRRTDYTAVMWLDETTLLPVRTSGIWDTGGDFSTTHEFLPRTDETRQLVVPPIPEGFTKVEQTRGDGASIEAGCQ